MKDCAADFEGFSGSVKDSYWPQETLGGFSRIFEGFSGIFKDFDGFLWDF